MSGSTLIALHVGDRIDAVSSTSNQVVRINSWPQLAPPIGTGLEQVTKHLLAAAQLAAARLARNEFPNIKATYRERFVSERASTVLAANRVERAAG